MTTETNQNYHLASMALQAAVPLRIMELLAMDDAQFQRTERRWRDEAEGEGVFSEAVLYQGAKPGDTARAFNGLAKALASLAFVPGGVTSFGGHFEATRRPRAAPAEQGGDGGGGNEDE